MGMVGNTTDANVAALMIPDQPLEQLLLHHRSHVTSTPSSMHTDQRSSICTYITSQFSSAHHLRQRQVLLGLHPL